MRTTNGRPGQAGIDVQYSLGELAERTGTRVHGDPACLIEGVGTLLGAGPGQISFLANPRYKRQLGATRAAAVILGEQAVDACPCNALVSRNPHLTYAQVAALFVREIATAPGVHPSAVVDPSCRVHPEASIGAHAVLGANVVVEAGAMIGPGCVLLDGSRIGEASRLVANVTVYEGTVIGRRALIHGGAVIGGDGFGFANDAGVWTKVAQLGRVRIGDDVEIGACTTVDRGAIDDTVIGNGVKLDNQIQVGHNVHIGEHTVIAACTGIAGSARIGSRCAIGGAVNVTGHIEITDGVTVTGTSFVSQSIEAPGVYSSGVPLEPTERWHKNFVRMKQLDEMARRLKSLEKELQELKQKG
jgi:UDP-3-O-[3-hydroxymyristoyl] glucosamine N-acyltransferase